MKCHKVWFINLFMKYLHCLSYLFWRRELVRSSLRALQLAFLSQLLVLKLFFDSPGQSRGISAEHHVQQLPCLFFKYFVLAFVFYPNLPKQIYMILNCEVLMNKIYDLVQKRRKSPLSKSQMLDYF